MYRPLALFGIALFSVAAASTNPSPTTQLTPTGPWNVDYAELSCSLLRPMSAAGEPYALKFTSEPLESRITLTIKHAERVNKRDSGDATVHIDGSARQAPAHFNFYRSPDKLAVREYLLDFGKHELGMMRDRLRVQTEKRGDFELHLPHFPAALKSLARCKADLHRSLGIDAAVMESMAVKPQGHISEFLDLPTFGDDGLNFILLYWVKEDGTIDQCRLLGPSGIKAFDENICPTLQKNGRLVPAKDAAGRSIRAPVYENARIRREVFTTVEPL